MISPVAFVTTDTLSMPADFFWQTKARFPILVEENVNEKISIMYKHVIIFVFMSITSYLSGQDFPIKSFLSADDKTTTVMMLGSFHFNYPNLDAHVTDKDKQVDVKSEKRRKELRELLDYIKRYRPTKIMIERNSWNEEIKKKYVEYLAGTFTDLPKSEIYQIGFRIAKELRPPEIYPIDAHGVNNDMIWHKDSLVLRSFLKEKFGGYSFCDGRSKYCDRYGEFYEYQDSILSTCTLLEGFRMMNDEDVMRLGHGAYLTTTSGVEEYDHMDALILYWYSRNLRIFGNVQALTEEGDRILVLMGAGHSSILVQQFDAHPMYTRVKFKDLESFPAGVR